MNPLATAAAHTVLRGKAIALIGTTLLVPVIVGGVILAYALHKIDEEEPEKPFSA